MVPIEIVPGYHGISAVLCPERLNSAELEMLHKLVSPQHGMDTGLAAHWQLWGVLAYPAWCQTLKQCAPPAYPTNTLRLFIAGTGMMPQVSLESIQATLLELRVMLDRFQLRRVGPVAEPTLLVAGPPNMRPQTDWTAVLSRVAAYFGLSSESFLHSNVPNAVECRRVAIHALREKLSCAELATVFGRSRANIYTALNDAVSRSAIDQLKSVLGELTNGDKHEDELENITGGDHGGNGNRNAEFGLAQVGPVGVGSPGTGVAGDGAERAG